MKKILALLLTLSILLTLSACGSATKDDEKSQNDISASTDKNDKETATDSSSPSENEQPSDTEDSGLELFFTETVAVDNENCSIIIKGIDSNNYFGYSIEVEVENKSTDANYMFTVDHAAINGVELNSLFATEVAAGKKANDDITFLDDEADADLIGAFTDIELTFRVYNSDDWMADDIALETIHIYPYGEENATTFVRESQADDQILIDNDDITVIVIGYEWDEIWGYNAKLFLVNKTDKNLMFSADDVSVNGFMADPLFSVTVSAGKCHFNEMTWFDSTLEENGITDIEEIEFSLRVYDSDDWSADDIANETFVLNP